MKLTLSINDDVFDTLKACAAKQQKSPNQLIVDNLALLLERNPQESQILLKSADIAKLSNALGGQILKTPDDVVKFLLDALKISVAGSEVSLCQEDAQALKDQFPSTSFKSYDEYVAAVVNEALSLHLWGSYRGVLAL